MLLPAIIVLPLDSAWIAMLFDATVQLASVAHGYCSCLQQCPALTLLSIAAGMLLTAALLTLETEAEMEQL